jgi:hypothetical protein
MRLLNRGLLCSVCCACALSLPVAAIAQDRAEPVPQSPQSGVTTASAELPDSPGAAWAKSQDSSQQDAGQQTSGSSSSQTAAPPDAQPNPPQSQNQKPQRPVGTAAAEAPKVSGITAAQPAGVAIAPAKQHRARAIIIRVGAIVGATAAIGTVVALSEATHSKPPGAH